MDILQNFPGGALAVVYAIGLLLVAGVVTIIANVVVGTHYNNDVLSKLPWNQWMTVREAVTYSRRNTCIVTCVITMLEEDIENEPLPGTTESQREDIAELGLEIWNAHLQRFRLIKGGKIRKRKRSKETKTRLLWRPAHA